MFRCANNLFQFSIFTLWISRLVWRLKFSRVSVEKIALDFLHSPSAGPRRPVPVEKPAETPLSRQIAQRNDSMKLLISVLKSPSF